MSGLRTCWLALGLILFGGWSAAAEQTTPRELPFDIRAQSLRDALNVFGKQAGLSIAFYDDAVVNQKTQGISGTFTPEAALAKLLANTQLKYQFVNERTVAIRSARPAQPLNSSTGVSTATGELQLASADGQARKQGDGVEEMLVEGTRDRPAPFSTANLDLTRTEDDVLPFTVFTARDIELSGSMNLEQFLQERLAQNFSADVLDEMGGSGGDADLNGTRVNFRGWNGETGGSETVFLLNGRRMPAQYQGQFLDWERASPNLRSIPLGSIERIEILSSAGSAIYGANATSGIVNIITRQDFKGGQLSVSYASPAVASAATRQANLSYGLPLKWGFGLRLGAGYGDREPMKVGDRSGITVERYRQRALEMNPLLYAQPVGTNPLITASNPVPGATPNIRARTPSTGNLFASLSSAPFSNFTSIPDGYTGGGLATFRPGVYNLALAEGSAGGSKLAKGSRVGNINTDKTLNVGLDKSFGERWRWSVDYSHAENNSEGGAAGELRFPAYINLSIPAAAPGNPFQQPVRMAWIDPQMDAIPALRNKSSNVNWALSSTLHGKFGEWNGFVDFSYSRNRNQYTYNEFWEPYGGWLNAFLLGTYNPFLDMRVARPASDDFYRHYIMRRQLSNSASSHYQSAAKVSGPVLRLPAGAVQLTAGISGSRGDRSQSFFVSSIFEDSLSGAPATPVLPGLPGDGVPDENPARQFIIDSYAAYAEMTVPLLSPRQSVPMARKLELFGSARLDRTKVNGFHSQSIADQQNGVSPRPLKYTNTSDLEAFGLSHEMLEGIAFRASRSVGFKPVPIIRVAPANPPTSNCGGCSPLFDPVRREPIDITSAMYLTGGNPELKPETTSSSDFGVILTPRWMPGMRMSLDYLQSIRNDAISSIDAETLVSLENEFPDRVQRGLPDGNASGVGPITFLDLRDINLRQISSKSIDFTVSREVRNVFGGRLILTAAISRNLSFKVQATNTGPAVEKVRSFSTAFAQQIEWNGNGQVRWEGRQWGFGWSTRYFDYILVDPGQVNYYRLQGSDRAPWKLNHDLNVSYRTPTLANPHGLQWLLSGTSIAFGVKNVFDREPRFWSQSFDFGVAPYDSVEGRSVWLNASKGF